MDNRMRIFLTLFRKEVKNLYRELCIIFAFQIGCIAYMLFDVYNGGGRHPMSVLDIFVTNILNYSLFFFYPALLVYSLFIEERTGTIYQMHSLPVKRSHLLIKFLVVLFAVVFIIYCISVTVFLGFYLDIIHANPEVSRHAILRLFYTTLINLCLVCTAWGIMRLVRKNRFFVGITAGFVGYGFFIWLAGCVRKIVVAQGNPIVYDTLAYNVFLLLMGGIFCMIGFFFYERFSEI